jgi:hypothetical protein
MDPLAEVLLFHLALGASGGLLSDRCLPFLIGGQSRQHECLRHRFSVAFVPLSDKFFENIGDQFGVVLFAQMLDLIGGQTDFFQVAGKSFPDGDPFFTFTEIKLGDRLLGLLQSYRISIAIVVFDNLFLVTAAFGWHLSILSEGGLCILGTDPIIGL